MADSYGELIQEPPGSEPIQGGGGLPPISGRYVPGKRRLGTFQEEIDRIEREQPGILRNPRVYRDVQQAYQMAQQQEMQTRQESLEAHKTLADVISLPKARRGPLLDLLGKTYAARVPGFDPETMTKTVSKFDDETAQRVANMVRAHGVEPDARLENLLQFATPEKAIQVFLSAAKEATAAEAEAERNKIAGEPTPGGTSTTEDIDQQEGALADIVRRLQERGGISESQQRGFKIRQDYLQAQRQRLTPRSKNLHFAQGPQGTQGLDPETGVPVGPALPAAPKMDSFANEADRIAGEVYGKPFAQLSQQERGIVNRRVYQERVNLAREQGVASAQGRMAVPERPTSGQQEKLAEFDSNVEAVRFLLGHAEDGDVKGILGVSPQAIYTRKKAEYVDGTLSDKQAIFLSQLAETSGNIRRLLVGQAQTIPEMRSLIPLLPKESDPPDRVFSKLKAILQGMERSRANYERILTTTGTQVPGRPTSAPQAEDPVAAARKRLGLE